MPWIEAFPSFSKVVCVALNEPQKIEILYLLNLNKNSLHIRKPPVTFEDVAGINEVRVELE